MLLQLPPELIVRILCLLDLPDYVSTIQTHSSISTYAQAFKVLKYRLATQAAAVEDNPFSRDPVSERLALLSSREDGWSQFLTDFRKTIPVVPLQLSFYDMTSGVYLLGDTNRGALYYYVLPTRPGDLGDWIRISIEDDMRQSNFTLADVGMSLYEHDLIAVATT